MDFEKMIVQGAQSVEWQKSINRHMRTLKLVQLKRLLGPDSVFTFYHKDIAVQFSLASVPYDYLENYIIETGQFYEKNILEQVEQFITNDSIVADIGANIGNHTIYFSLVCGCRHVYSFEPQRRAFKSLQTNLYLNNINNCTCSNLMLGAAEGSASIRAWDSNNLGGTAFAANPDGRYPMSTLDKFAFDKLDFIKMDVEDMEYKVLCGAEQTIKKFKPILWLELKREEQQREAAALLRDWGYGSPTSIASHPWAWLFRPRM